MTKKQIDMVNKPPHYTQEPIECIDVIKIMTKHLTGIEAFTLGNHIKYLWREHLKNGDEDINKADWYWIKYKQERTLRKSKQK